MNNTDKQYHDLLFKIMNEGTEKTDRTRTGTKSIFGHQMRFNLEEGFPLVTRKKTWFKGIAHELLWFLQGGTNINYLQKNGVHIWDEWADENGDLGPVYGKQWVNWESGLKGNGINQVQNIINTLKTSPDSRRMIVSAWNTAEIPSMKLAPCHIIWQLNTRPLTSRGMRNLVEQKGNYDFDPYNEECPEEELIQLLHEEYGIPKYYLDLQIYQRSCDTFLGVPFNIASYALLAHMIAHCCNMIPGDLVWTGGDVHLYKNHFDQVNEFLSRGEGFDLPKIYINPNVRDIFQIEYEDIKLIDYKSYDSIQAPIAV